VVVRAQTPPSHKEKVVVTIQQFLSCQVSSKYIGYMISE